MSNSSVVLDSTGIRIDGEYRILLCSSLFYFRIPRELWRDRIRKLKKAGYNCVDVYFPWNFHEVTPGNWRFSGNADAGAFLDLLAEENMCVMARPGPYICSEWDGGSLPAWILASDMPVRENSPDFLAQTEKWYEKILPVLAAHEYGRGGTVILVQLDNELDFFDCPDPKAYMEALKKVAVSQGIRVPVTGCAGQGGTLQATGLSPEIIPTYNFYPDPFIPQFDNLLFTAAKTVAALNVPLMITETGGEHFLLRREIANGARLVGPYNQAAGVNFGFTNSINNWGPGNRPLSFIATDYGAGKLISPYGEYNRPALEGRLLGAMLRVLGGEFAGASAKRNDRYDIRWDDNGRTDSARVLEAKDGGRFLCVPNFREAPMAATVRSPDAEFTVTVPGHSAPFFGFHLQLGSVRPGFTVPWTSAEIIDTGQGRLVCYGEADSQVCIQPDGCPETVISGYGNHQAPSPGGQITVSLLRREEAQQYDRSGVPFGTEIGAGGKSVRLTTGVLRAGAPAFRPLRAGGPLPMESNGIYRGFALYKASAEPHRPVLISGAADIVSAYAGGAYIDTRVSGGTCQLYPPAASREWQFRVESWGHCNFDDPRLPSLRLKSRKGLEAVYSVNRTQEDLLWRCVLVNQWLPARLRIKESPFDALIPPDGWNTTRTPLLAAYYAEFTGDPDSRAFMLELPGNAAETAVYIDGALAGSVNPLAPWVNLSDLVKPGGPSEIILLCRKRNWTEPVGIPRIYHMTPARVHISAFTDEDAAKLSAELPAAGASGVSFPVSLTGGDVKVMDVDLDGMPHVCARAQAEAEDLKLTAVFNGRVVGRIIGRFEGSPLITGGDPKSFYIPGPWFEPSGNRLSLLLEGIGPRPVLSSVTFHYVKTAE